MIFPTVYDKNYVICIKMSAICLKHNKLFFEYFIYYLIYYFLNIKYRYPLKFENFIFENIEFFLFLYLKIKN